MVKTHPAEHRTILAVDVEGFGDRRRSNLDQAVVRSGYYRALRRAFDTAGIPWKKCRCEDRGDGAFVLAPPDVRKDLFAEALPGALAKALTEHNEARPAEERIRLRMVLHAGEVIIDGHGATSASINLAFRLLEAPPLKEALAGSRGVLAVIASQWFFDEVVRHCASRGAATWRHARVSVKETSVPAWISLPDDPYPRDEAALRAPRAALALPVPVPVPRQLPGSIPHFVGRSAELRRLTAALDAAAAGERGTVVISAIGGTAGIGKSALAIRWAHQVADRFPDGQLYVDLRGFDPVGAPMRPAEAVRSFLDAFAIPPEKIPADVDAQAALYRSLLAGRRVLVLLDNARDSDQIRSLLPGASGCVALITSRDQLADMVAREGLQPVALDLLGQDESVQLLARMLGTARVAAEMDAVADLVERCARLPLALAIVAARAAINPRIPLRVIAAELRGEPDRPDAPNAPNAPNAPGAPAALDALDALDAGDPASGVRAAFTCSYRTLDAPAARTLRLLGLHPGPDIGLPAAAALAGLDSAAARTPLARLTRAHLLTEYAPGRYWHHDLLRAYAAERAAGTDSPADRRAALGRLLDYYTHSAFAADRRINPGRDPIALPPARPEVVVESCTDAEAAWAWFAAEHANLLAAIERAGRAGLDAHAWQLAWTMVTYLDRRGHWHDLLDALETALAAAVRAADRAAQAGLHRLLSHANLLLRRPAAAFDHLDRCVALWRALGDRVGQATAHHGYSLACEQEHSHARAITHARHALDLYRAEGHRTGEAVALNTLAANYLRLGDPHQALEHCRQALELFVDLDDRVGRASALETLGDAVHRLGRPDRAIAVYQEAVELRRELGDHYLEAVARARLGDIHHSAGDQAAAVGAWQSALVVFDRLAHPDAAEVRAKLAVAVADNR